RGLVGASSSDLEDAVALLELEGLGHHRDDDRLRDRLPAADRERTVLVRAGSELLGDEAMPRHLANRFEHARSLDLAGELREESVARALEPSLVRRGSVARSVRALRRIAFVHSMVKALPSRAER